MISLNLIRRLQNLVFGLSFCGFSAQAVMAPHNGPDNHNLRPRPSAQPNYGHILLPTSSQKLPSAFAHIQSLAELEVALDQLAARALDQFQDPELKLGLSRLYGESHRQTYRDLKPLVGEDLDMTVAAFRIRLEETRQGLQKPPVFQLSLPEFLQQMPFWAQIYRIEALVQMGQLWEQSLINQSSAYLKDIWIPLSASAIVYSGPAQALILNDFVYETLRRELKQSTDFSQAHFTWAQELLAQLRFQAQMSATMDICGQYLSQSQRKLR